jgi:hypothetical protein
VPTVTITEQEVIFLSVLREVLPTLRNLDDGRLIKKIGNERFHDGCDEIYSYLEIGIDSPLKKLEQSALINKILRLLSSYVVEQMHLALTLKTLFDCFSLFPTAVEQSFPGYHSSRLLRYLIK